MAAGLNCVGRWTRRPDLVFVPSMENSSEAEPSDSSSFMEIEVLRRRVGREEVLVARVVPRRTRAAGRGVAVAEEEGDCRAGWPWAAAVDIVRGVGGGAMEGEGWSPPSCGEFYSKLVNSQ